MARSRPDNREIRIKGGRIREVELYQYTLHFYKLDKIMAVPTTYMWKT